MLTHYQTLKVSRDAPPEVIRMAYKVLCQKYHPDKYPENRESAERITKELTAAYAVLSDPDKKKAYDEFLDGIEAKGGQEKPPKSAKQDHKPKEEPKQEPRYNTGDYEAKPNYKPHGSQQQPPQSPPKPCQQPESHHPWRRMAARYIDMNIFALIGGFAYLLIFPEPENPVDSQLIYAVVALFGCILIEPVVLMLFGGTLGKAILNIRLESKAQSSIQALPFTELLKRTFQVYFFGLGLGLYLIVAPFFFMFKDYKRMKQTGVTRWDKACGTQVSFGDMGLFRFLAGATLVLAFLTLNLVSKSLNRAERKEWYAAKYKSGEYSQAIHTQTANPLDQFDQRDRIDDFLNAPTTQPSNPTPKTAEEFLAKYHPEAQENAQTQFNRGLAYYNGQGVPKSYTEAAKWWQLAAEQGFAHAQFNLGVAYDQGQGVQQNYAEAAKWYRMAAEQGDARAQFNLGVAYDQGQGVQQNYTEAAKWWQLAADQGDADAQFNLGTIYHQGHGVTQNYAEAEKWFRLAAEQGLAKAQNLLGALYDNGDGVQKNYAEAAKWLRLAAEQGNVHAQSRLGSLYYSGRGVTQNYIEAAKWLRLAAEQGDATAQAALGLLYDSGHGVPQNYTEAAKWYRMAAEQGNVYAQNILGALYENGMGVMQNDIEAAKWYRMAAEQGNATAQAALNRLYGNPQ